jgi:hypothetical protein
MVLWNDEIRRPIWLAALLGAGFGVAIQVVVEALRGTLVEGPVLTMLVPGAIGLLAAVVIRSGWGAVGLVVGIVVASQVGSSLRLITAPGTMDLVLALVSALLGYGTGFAVTQRDVMADFKPPAPADLARVESEVRLQLRSIDPDAPGAFERATVLLRKVNEQANTYGPWMGPVPAGGEIGPPIGLLDLQAELVETARLAAIAAGARRVIITSNGMGGGIDVQAIFGDPISPDEPLPPPTIEPV